jgi:hypothetical protein
MINKKVSETNFAKYELENSVLTIKFKDGLLVDQPIMKQLLQDAVEFANHEKYFTIIDLTNNVDTTFESRNYYAQNELNKYRLADAFIVNSLYLQSLTNFYLRIKKPSVPSKMFNDFESARKWVFSMQESFLIA